MKFFKWKIFFITGVVCLLPVILGILLWDRLPETIAIHFNLYGEPDNYASKGIVVLGLPVMMLIMQGFCCFINDLTWHRNGREAENFTKWIIPCLTVVLYVITLGYSLGWNIDIRKSAAITVGVLFLVTGIYMSNMDYIKNYNIDKEKAKKINTFVGRETAIMGLLFLISALLPPDFAIIFVGLLIPYVIIAIIYGFLASRKEDV